MTKANDQAKGAPRVRPRGGRMSAERYDEILDHSINLFLAKGYEAVSTDDIVAAIGGSKATLYRRFGNKAGLFRLAVEKYCDEINRPLFMPLDPSAPCKRQLLAFGQRFLETITNEKTLKLHRLVVSIGDRFPTVSRIFYEAGPHSSYTTLGKWIEVQQTRGKLKAGDPYILASLYIDMLTGRHQLALLSGLRAESEKFGIEATVKSAVDIFLNGLTRSVRAPKAG